MPEIENGQIVQTPADARAGGAWHSARFMLVFGVIGLFAVVYFYPFA